MLFFLIKKLGWGSYVTNHYLDEQWHSICHQRVSVQLCQLSALSTATVVVCATCRFRARHICDLEKDGGVWSGLLLEGSEGGRRDGIGALAHEEYLNISAFHIVSRYFLAVFKTRHCLDDLKYNVNSGTYSL